MLFFCCSDLDEAEHISQGLALLLGEFETHLGILLLSHNCPGEVLLHKSDNLLTYFDAMSSTNARETESVGHGGQQ